MLGWLISFVLLFLSFSKGIVELAIAAALFAIAGSITWVNNVNEKGE